MHIQLIYAHGRARVEPFLCAVRRDIWRQGCHMGHQKPPCSLHARVFDSSLSGTHRRGHLKGIGIFTDEALVFLPVMWSKSKLMRYSNLAITVTRHTIARLTPLCRLI